MVVNSSKTLNLCNLATSLHV